MQSNKYNFPDFKVPNFKFEKSTDELFASSESQKEWNKYIKI